MIYDTDGKLMEIAQNGTFSEREDANKELQRRQDMVHRSSNIENTYADNPPSEGIGVSPDSFSWRLEYSKKIILFVLFVISFLFVLSVAWWNNALRFESIFGYIIVSVVVSYVLYLVLSLLYWVLIGSLVIAGAVVVFFVISLVSPSSNGHNATNKIQSTIKPINNQARSQNTIKTSPH